MITKIILVFVGLYLLWYFFHRPESLLRWTAVGTTNFILWEIFFVARAVGLGAIVYFLIVVFGNLDRISSPSDIVTIVTAKASRVGMPGLLGFLFGGLVAVYNIVNIFVVRPRPKNDTVRGRTLLQGQETPVNQGMTGVVKSLVRKVLKR